MKYLLDTNICIALLKNSDLTIVKKLKSLTPDQVVICSIVKAELLYGARKSQSVEKNLSLLSKFFNQLESLPFDDSATDYYGTQRSILEKAGTTIGNADLLIAGIALAHDLTVVTRNQNEFIRVQNLRVEVW
ncbi:MAG: type II toxin-antitoxin system VapC family toxin [Deltaproteobacteria bacterium]|jgi:tRNA(fMet)-specific endonuclease VapC|nr:type II toxin-antitoxin system VapC family toxin [Deltaproteobacteria bacterium]